MKNALSFILIAAILSSTWMITPAAPEAAAESVRASNESAARREAAMMNALFVQQDGTSGENEEENRCRQLDDELKKFLESLRNSFPKANEAFNRALLAMGLSGAFSMQTVMQKLPGLWDRLISFVGGGKFILEYLSFASFCIWIYDEIDDGAEGLISLAFQQAGIPQEQADEFANEITDGVIHDMAINLSGNPAMSGMAWFLHFRELIAESTKCRRNAGRGRLRQSKPPGPPHHTYNRNGVRQYESDGGMLGGYNCIISGPGAMPSEQPGSEPIPTIDGGEILVTATALPPCP